MSSVHSSLAKERRPLEILARLTANWLVIVAVPFIVWQTQSIWVGVLGFILVAAQQHALSLWLHEGAHWFFTANKKQNDAITQALLAWPLFMSLDTYRERHFTHHRRLGTVEDTKQVIFQPVRGRAFLGFALSCCLGLRFVQLAREYQPGAKPSRARGSAPWHLAGVAIVQAVILGVFTLLSHWSFYFLFWMLPFMTLLQLFAAVRAICEHQPGVGDPAHPFTRRLNPTLLDRVLFCRAGFDQHWVHHRFSAIPFFNLKAVPEARMQRELDSASGVSYVRALWTLVTQAEPAKQHCQAEPIAQD